jgi:16S rRNA (adenine1518-N6/adenine1519-N6)-dimethyltransferase
LLEAGAEVWAVEKDARLHRHLAATLAPRFSSLHLTLGDALDLPRAELPSARAAHGFKVVANLPYAISTPWMEALLDDPLPARLVLMLQQEAAQRYAAAPGSKSFGAISIFLQSAYAVAPGHAVSAACFYPRPEVASHLLHLVRRPQPFLFDRPRRELIRALFRQRRKQLGALLRESGHPVSSAWWDELSAAGLSPRARPEDIPVALWQRL